MSPEYTGKCLCGAVTYVAKGPPVIVAQCHCEECRRLSGTGHSVGAMFQSKYVAIDGRVNTFTYQSGKNTDVTKALCAQCGSPIFGQNSGNPDHLTLTLGTMDDASDLKVDVVIFARDQPTWDELEDDVTCFQTQPDWNPST